MALRSVQVIFSIAASFGVCYNSKCRIRQLEKYAIQKNEISLNLGGNSFSMISHDLRKMPVEGVKWNVEKL